MTDRVKISKTPEAVAKTGSYKVEYPGGVEYFHYDDEPSRRLRPEQVDQETAKKQAQEFARVKADEPKPD